MTTRNRRAPLAGRLPRPAKRCTIKVALAGLPSVVVEERRASLQAAMDGAMRRAEAAVKRSTKRRTTRAR